MSGQTIENLQIEIVGTATSASTSLDSLTTALAKLKSTTKSGLKLNASINQLKKFNDTLKSITVTQAASDSIKKLVDAVAPLQNVQKASGLNSVVKSLKEIPNITEALKSTNMDAFSAQIRRVTESVRPLAAEMEKVSKGFSTFPTRIQKLITQNEKLTTSNSKLNKSYGVLGTGIKGVYLKAYGVYTAYSRIIGIVSDWFTESNDYIEAINLFRVTMGDAAEAAYKYAEAVQKVMGIDAKEWVTAQGSFQQLIRGYGVAQDYTTTMSKNLTQIGYDLSSLWNVEVQTAMDKLQSGMSGQIKGLKVWGINLSVASLQETALAHGINESVRAMSEADKAILRYVTIMEKTTNVQGDLGRTLVTPANALRILEAQVTQAKRALGQLVSVLAVKVIPYVQAFVELVKEGAENLAKMWGYTLPDIDYSGLGTGELDAATEAAENYKKTVLGIDELNLMSDNSPSNSKTNELNSPVSSLLENLYDNDNWLAGVETVVDDIKEEMQGWFDIAVKIGAVFLTWKLAQSVVTFFANLGTALPIMKTLFGTGAGGIAFAVSSAMSAFKFNMGSGGGFFSSLGTGLSTFRGNLSGVNKVILGAGGLVAAFGLAKSAGKDFAEDGVLTTGSAIKGLTGVGMGALSGYIIGGPLGALIGGLGALADSYYTAISEAKKMKDTKFIKGLFEKQTQSIDDLKQAYQDSLSPISDYIDKMKILSGKLKDTKTKFSDAYDKTSLYFTLWDERGTLETEDIDTAVELFQNMSTTLQEINTINFDTIFSSLGNAINDNLGKDALSNISELTSELALLKSQISGGISTLESEATAILLKAQKNGGSLGADKSRLKEIFATFSVISNTENVDYSKTQAEVAKISSNLSFGDNASEAAENVKNVLAMFDNLTTGAYAAREQAKSALEQTKLNADTLGISYDPYLFIDAQKAIDNSYAAQLKKIKLQRSDAQTAMMDAFNKDVLTPAQEYLTTKGDGIWIAGHHYEGPDAVPTEDMVLDHNWGDNSGTLRDILDAINTSNKYLDEQIKQSPLKYEISSTQNSDKLSKWKIKPTAYATGGFPEDGFFYANHNELVGEFSNGKTAVANNEQIIEGIKQGVREANLETNGQGGGEIVINLYDSQGEIKTTKVISDLNRKNKRDGKTVVSVEI